MLLICEECDVRLTLEAGGGYAQKLQNAANVRRVLDGTFRTFARALGWSCEDRDICPDCKEELRANAYHRAVEVLRRDGK